MNKVIILSNRNQLKGKTLNRSKTQRSQKIRNNKKIIILLRKAWLILHLKKVEIFHSQKNHQGHWNLYPRRNQQKLKPYQNKNSKSLFQNEFPSQQMKPIKKNRPNFQEQTQNHQKSLNHKIVHQICNWSISK